MFVDSCVYTQHAPDRANNVSVIENAAFTQSCYVSSVSTPYVIVSEKSQMLREKQLSS
jgi:hypothetical protein